MTYDRVLVDKLLDYILRTAAGEDGLLGSVQEMERLVRRIREPAFRSTRRPSAKPGETP